MSKMPRNVVNRWTHKHSPERSMLALTENGRLAVRRANPWVGLWIVLSAAFMGIMDVFITVVAAPAIRSDLGATVADTQLVLAAYNLAFALVLITSGRLGDLFGRRRIFSPGLALFTAGSLAASLSPDPITLILARALLGVAAGLMMPQVFSIIQANFEGEDRGKAFGAFAFVSGLAATTAQVVGGVLITADLFALGCRAIFLVNVPIGVLALAAAQVWVGAFPFASAALDIPHSHSIVPGGFEVMS
ncbi:MAG TPA: MFS transporter [Dehalococcoidia bacterium]|nr:MFS transporter [Dehalococcoidia bacterium]